MFVIISCLKKTMFWFSQLPSFYREIVLYAGDKKFDNYSTTLMVRCPEYINNVIVTLLRRSPHSITPRLVLITRFVHYQLVQYQPGSWTDAFVMGECSLIHLHRTNWIKHLKFASNGDIPFLKLNELGYWVSGKWYQVSARV